MVRLRSSAEEGVGFGRGPPTHAVANALVTTYRSPNPQPGAPLGVDPKTVRRYISQGRLKAARVGPRLIRIERESLESLGKPVGGGAQ